MNSKPIFKLFNPRGKAQTVVHQGISTLIISSVVLSLIALTAWAPIVRASGPEPNGQHTIEAPPKAEVKHEVDPDADIGLLEFFSPGYGALTSVLEEAEVLPTVGMGMDEDIGLMDFFIIPDEAGAPQAVETDADQDIGLMEFSPQTPVDQR